ncbi:MAG TPA: DUF1080 domain-containing protein [Verrucomicrobiae bacterium]
MNRTLSPGPVALGFSLVVALASCPALAADTEPPVVDPGAPGQPPADAIVLFNGKDLAEWKSESGRDAKWKVQDGYMEVNKTGSVLTRKEFGDVQLHIEWATPAVVQGEGQGRGNSGVYFQGRYEVQVLDSYQNKTYPDGQAAAIYKISAPLVNVSRKPGEWQSYDIIFRAPKPAQGGGVQPGFLTVFHNGVLVQDHVPLKGDATTAAKFSGAVPKGPLMLQDHGNPVRYRNIWVRPL